MPSNALLFGFEANDWKNYHFFEFEKIWIFIEWNDLNIDAEDVKTSETTWISLNLLDTIQRIQRFSEELHLRESSDTPIVRFKAESDSMQTNLRYVPEYKISCL